MQAHKALTFDQDVFEEMTQGVSLLSLVSFLLSSKNMPGILMAGLYPGNEKCPRLK